MKKSLLVVAALFLFTPTLAFASLNSTTVADQRVSVTTINICFTAGSWSTDR